MRFRIAMDSAGELAPSMQNRPEYPISPLTLIIGDEEIIDDGTLDQDELVHKIAASPECPRTACPSPEAYLQAFECDADHIYGITISAELSGSYQSAKVAEDMFLAEHPDAKIHVFNSRSTSVAETMVAMMIEDMEEEGCSFEEIVEKVEAYCIKKDTYFTLDNLETLRKNGRLSNLKALAANLLKIKPICIGTDEGTIEQLDQARGSTKALKKMCSHIVRRTTDPATRRLGIAYVNCLDRAHMVRDAILKEIPVKEVIIQKTGGLSTTYANDGGIIVVI